MTEALYAIFPYPLLRVFERARREKESMEEKG
jgi:hypothetical protein